MLRSALTTLSVLSIALLLFFLAFHIPPAQGALLNHLVISEVKIAGVSSTDEFIELYNPTTEDIQIENWRITKKTSLQTGTGNDLVSSLSATIASHGYLLITHPTGYIGSAAADVTYDTNESLSANNTVLLYSQSGAIIDKVGWGSAIDNETSATGSISTGLSKERKASLTSTQATMSTGAEKFEGNGEDTDNNLADFLTRSVPEPQNSQSNTEPAGPTPTIIETSSTPTPTESGPTPTDEATPTPSPTSIPSLTPTQTPTSTPTLTPTTTPSTTVAPTPTRSPFPVFPQMKVICTTKTISVRFMNLMMEFPYPFCTIARI